MANITPLQQKVLELFASSPLKNRFYWTGGTLLSFCYLQHRLSRDLDFFSDAPFSHSQVIKFVQKLKKDLALSFVEEKKIFDRWEFFLHNKRELRVDFVFYDHPRIRPRKKWRGIFIDSLEDIAANKAMSVLDRHDPKDLIDLYFLLDKKKIKIKSLLKWTERKFGVKISESNLWSESLRKIDDLETVSPLLIAQNNRKKKMIIQGIKNYFSSKATDYLERELL